MTILTWNIRHGGGNRTSAICRHLTTKSGGGSAAAASTLILTEFRSGRTGNQIQTSLAEHGFRHQATPPTASPKQNSVLVASKHPFQALAFHDLGADAHRCIRAEFDGLILYAVYFALDAAKVPLFEFLCRLDPSILDQTVLVIGDFNTGRNGIDHEGVKFTAAEYFERLQDQGWVDTWRSRNPHAREYSWYSQKGGASLNGFRIDHALASPKLDPDIKSVRYLHEVRTSAVPLSDHSAMLVEL